MEDVKQFNRSLFEDHGALPVSEIQLELLIEAAEANWSDVEPAIFWKAPGACPRPEGAAQAQCPLHASGVREAPGGADRDRAVT